MGSRAKETTQALLLISCVEVHKESSSVASALMWQACSILLSAKLDAFREASTQTCYVAVLVDVVAAALQATSIRFPCFFPALLRRASLGGRGRAGVDGRKDRFLGKKRSWGDPPQQMKVTLGN